MTRTEKRTAAQRRNLPPKKAPEDDFFAVCGPSAPQQKVEILVPTGKMDVDRELY